MSWENLSNQISALNKLPQVRAVVQDETDTCSCTVECHDGSTLRFRLPDEPSGYVCLPNGVQCRYEESVGFLTGLFHTATTRHLPRRGRRYDLVLANFRAKLPLPFGTPTQLRCLISSAIDGAQRYSPEFAFVGMKAPNGDDNDACNDGEEDNACLVPWCVVSTIVLDDDMDHIGYTAVAVEYLFESAWHRLVTAELKELSQREVLPSQRPLSVRVLGTAAGCAFDATLLYHDRLPTRPFPTSATPSKPTMSLPEWARDCFKQELRVTSDMISEKCAASNTGRTRPLLSAALGAFTSQALMDVRGMGHLMQTLRERVPIFGDLYDAALTFYVICRDNSNHKRAAAEFICPPAGVTDFATITQTDEQIDAITQRLENGANSFVRRSASQAAPSSSAGASQTAVTAEALSLSSLAQYCFGTGIFVAALRDSKDFFQHIVGAFQECTLLLEVVRSSFNFFFMSERHLRAFWHIDAADGIEKHEVRATWCRLYNGLRSAILQMSAFLGRDSRFDQAIQAKSVFELLRVTRKHIERMAANLGQYFAIITAVASRDPLTSRALTPSGEVAAPAAQRVPSDPRHHNGHIRGQSLASEELATPLDASDHFERISRRGATFQNRIPQNFSSGSLVGDEDEPLAPRTEEEIAQFYAQPPQGRSRGPADFLAKQKDTQEGQN